MTRKEGFVRRGLLVATLLIACGMWNVGETQADPAKFAVSATGGYDLAKSRQVLVNLMQGLENATGREAKASQILREADEQQMEALVGFLENKERFFAAADRIGSRLQAAQQAPPAVAASAAKPAVQPAYPVETGLYAIEIMAPLRILNLTQDVTKRCDGVGLTDYTLVMMDLDAAAKVADAVCSVAGCDPTGIGCAIVCVLVETALGLLELAKVPLTLCGIHDGNVNAAEVAATYENSRIAVTTLEAEAAAIKSQLTTHDVDIKSLLQVQQEITANLDGIIDTLKNIVKMLHDMQQPRLVRRVR